VVLVGSSCSSPQYQQQVRFRFGQAAAARAIPAETGTRDWADQRFAALLLATCRSRHAVGPDVVVTVGPNALLSSGAGTRTRRRRAVQGPAFTRREVSLPKSAETPVSPLAQPTAPAAPIGVGSRLESPALPRKEERVLARSWLIPPPGSAEPGRRRDRIPRERSSGPPGADERNGDISLVARTCRRAPMRSRGAVSADGLCVGSAAILRAVESALVSATRRTVPPGSHGPALRGTEGTR
jgi:hypothetical protein